jgi:hypothetical protein
LVRDLPIGRNGSPTRSVLPMRSRHSSATGYHFRAQPQRHSNNPRIQRTASLALRGGFHHPQVSAWLAAARGGLTCGSSVGHGFGGVGGLPRCVGVAWAAA